MPENLDYIIKDNKIDLITSIGEVYGIKRDVEGNCIGVDLEGGEKLLEKLCSYNLPMIHFTGNMFTSLGGKNIIMNF